MNVSIETVHFSNEKIWLQLNDSRILGVPLVYFPVLEAAETEQLEKYELSPHGIHWDELNEDLSLEGFLNTQKLQPVRKS